VKQQEGESAIEFMRRIVECLGHEYESILFMLPTIPAIVGYAELWTVYDTEYLCGICEAIELGADPAPLNDFIATHNLIQLRNYVNKLTSSLTACLDVSYLDT